MDILENDEPRFHDAKFMGCRTEMDGVYKVVIATMTMPSSDQNINACMKLYMNVSKKSRKWDSAEFKDDIELKINCPAEFDDDIPTLEQLLLDYEQWKKILNNHDLYKGQKMELTKRELSKILCEFFLPITDGRK